jgi:branched-chain amino acid aminotransferase
VTPSLVASLDGRIVPRRGLFLPSGFWQGDGVFETVRTYGGAPFRLLPHLGRLVAGAKAIGLTAVPPPSMLEATVRSVLTACQAGSDAPEWVCRACLFFDEGRTAQVVLADPWDPSGASPGVTGLATGRSSYRHPGAFLRPAGAAAPVKWIARGPLAHALREARARGWGEALLANEHDGLVEGTRSNLFVAVDRGHLVAPGPDSGALAGITREAVLELARARHIAVEDRPVQAEELARVPEAFLTSTLLGVAPITEFEGVRVGAATHGGPISLELGRALETLARGETEGASAASG